MVRANSCCEVEDAWIAPSPEKPRSVTIGPRSSGRSPEAGATAFFAKSSKAGDTSNAAGVENFGGGALKAGCVVSPGAAVAGIVPKRVTMRTKVVITGRICLVFIIYSPQNIDETY